MITNRNHIIVRLMLQYRARPTSLLSLPPRSLLASILSAFRLVEAGDGEGRRETWNQGLTIVTRRGQRWATSE